MGLSSCPSFAETPMKLRPPSATEISVLGKIAAQTFGFPAATFGDFVKRVGPDNLRVAIDGDSIAGGLAYYPLRQWFGGRDIPMAGVALVCVPPEKRAGGVARFMMSSLLAEFRQAGIALSTLFASTQIPYRRVGFEQAGSWNHYQLALTQIGPRPAPLPIHSVDQLSATKFARLAEARARVTNGNLQRSDGVWQRLLTSRDAAHPVHGYLIGEVDQPEGYLLFEQIMRPEHERRYLQVRDMVATSGRAMESAWAFLYGHRSIFPNVRWYGPPTDPWLVATDEAHAMSLFHERWMLRIVDVVGALEQRGYPQLLNETLDIEVHDDLIASNSGRFRVEIHQGKASVTPGGKGDLRMDVRALAPLFSRFMTASTLHSLGMLDGSVTTLQKADAIFAGPEPWMPDKF